uniref:Uncharacterized protein n=1 Tax=Mycena chlorophos TaxID=658473 RepID=A0ABQ0LZA4_MYCCL|nr:predicted protein [Mycena chlorophos]
MPSKSIVRGRRDLAALMIWRSFEHEDPPYCPPLWPGREDHPTNEAYACSRRMFFRRARRVFGPPEGVWAVSHSPRA